MKKINLPRITLGCLLVGSLFIMPSSIPERIHKSNRNYGISHELLHDHQLLYGEQHYGDLGQELERERIRKFRERENLEEKALN